MNESQGGHPSFPVKLGFEIAVDRKTKTHQNYLRGLKPQPPSGARGVATPLIGQFLALLCQITSKCPKPRLLFGLTFKIKLVSFKNIDI